MFLDHNILYVIPEKSNKYTQFCNCPDPKITLDQLKCSLGLRIFYWYSEAGTGKQVVKEAMGRDRFIQIILCRHYKSR